jgi:SAM-dependent methyltransferase
VKTPPHLARLSHKRVRPCSSARAQDRTTSSAVKSGCFLMTLSKDLNSGVRTFAKTFLNKESRIFLRRFWYAGDKYHCHVCNNNVRSMLTRGYEFPVLTELDVIGSETLPFDTCPICFSNSRARLLLEYIQRETSVMSLDSPISILHIAPEYGIFLRLRTNKAIDYRAVDISPQEYRDAGGVAYCDITAINHSDESFDLVICSHVLEHIPDDRRAMKELFRVLKRGGTAILQVPISASLPSTVEDPLLSDPRERERRFGQHDHVRIYGADYTTRLQKCGFLVETFDPNSRWGNALVEELRLNPREKLFIGRK